jgi:hypothetical protein
MKNNIKRKNEKMPEKGFKRDINIVYVVVL